MSNDIKPIAEIKNAEINDDILSLSFKITCGYEPVVHSPKVTLLFDDGVRTRYIPVPIQSYYQNVDQRTCTIIAEYNYAINSIFFSTIKDEEIGIKVNLMYGDDTIDSVDLKLTGDMKSGEDFVVAYKEDGAFVLKRSKPYVNKKQNPVLFVLKLVLGGLYNIIVRLVGIAIIPWLLFDSLMAAIGVKSGYVSTKDRTTFRYFVDYVRVGFKAITREEIGRRNLKMNLAIFFTWVFRNSKVVKNRVTFLSNRRDDLSGNFEDIYNEIKEDQSLEICMLLDPAPMHRMSFRSIYKFAKFYATSAVVIIDDFYELTSMVSKKPDVTLVQVWHACGAFKTFGFSRLGKPGGPKQTNINHRMYDRAIVSSSEIRRFYAEGFGIPLDNVVATGVPRTDMFFSDEIKAKKQEEFYSAHPNLRDKKIILFAPTFRGNGRLTGHYKMDRFNLKEIYESIGDGYAILVKMHPFVADEVNIPKEYEDVILDYSGDSELNDLLFVTDVLITDYSSCVFEASLLDIPMLMYAYDLSEYIATRDFYYEYEPFLPGKLVTTQEELKLAIRNEDFETEKIEPFKKRFFDHLDGKSAKRVADMIRDLVASSSEKTKS